MAKDNKNNAPKEENEREIFVLTDEAGKESQFELIDEIEVDGNLYYAMVPIEEGAEEYVILKVVPDENGDVSIPSGTVLEPMTLYPLFENAADAKEGA